MGEVLITDSLFTPSAIAHWFCFILLQLHLQEKIKIQQQFRLQLHDQEYLAAHEQNVVHYKEKSKEKEANY